MEVIFRKILIFQKCYFPKKKIFLSVWLHFRKCCEKYFLVFGCIVENAIFLQIFHTTIQPTAANFDNQKPQPPKHHHHTTTTTTKIKITQRERSVGRRGDRAEARSKVRSSRCDHRTGAHEIERRGAINKTGATGACDRRTGARGSPTIVGLD